MRILGSWCDRQFTDGRSTMWLCWMLDVSSAVVSKPVHLLIEDTRGDSRALLW